jgi:hypothetical protein
VILTLALAGCGAQQAKMTSPRGCGAPKRAVERQVGHVASGGCFTIKAPTRTSGNCRAQLAHILSLAKRHPDALSPHARVILPLVAKSLNDKGSPLSCAAAVDVLELGGG